MGLIPTRAGSTPIGQWFQCQSSAHPRSRGEHDLNHIQTDNAFGSSPLARGTPEGTKVTATLPRLIPACAGNTVIAAASITSFSAHPRSRGEHRYASATERWPLGSSPLARGTSQGSHRWPEMVRLIPARAGDTEQARSKTRQTRAHPRLRGEHGPMVSSLVRSCGSSPLTRGARGTVRGAALGHRLIPAHAGSTVRLGNRHAVPAAHPRSRGEHSGGLPRLMMSPGSSPLTRGAQITASRFFTTIRLIPAHAGSTWIRGR